MRKEPTTNIQLPKQRFEYIDQFRGLVGILMLVGHSSYYFNSIWNQLDPFNPLFSSWSQFALRYMGYLCAPGFLMMSGAMVWWSYHKRIEKGIPSLTAQWHLIQRGIFLVFVQMTWVNSSWGGFSHFNPWHFGIISSIGFSMILLTLIVKMRWQIQLIIALAILIIHPFLLKIPYDPQIMWERVIMQTFIDSGTFNKYPVLPWFALATLGSVMANGWLSEWKTENKKIYMSIGISLIVFLIAITIRLGREWGNTFSFSDFGSYSFFLDQKYPPSLFMSLWSFAAVVGGVGIFIAIGKVAPKALNILSIPGKVPLFFYIVHLAILGVFVKRFDLFYREGGVLTSLIGALVLFIIMIPLCQWFYKFKRNSNNYFIQMM
ncbi:MAG: heparan-alpha-glucosaminide N-acetyltransferase domain-containing protein [Bacteroidota bacterium]